MSWNYRVIRHEDGTLALHEVYYDEAGTPVMYTVEPANFAVDADEGLSDLIAALETALRDAKERPVLNAQEIGNSGHLQPVQSAAGSDSHWDQLETAIRELNEADAKALAKGMLNTPELVSCLPDETRSRQIKEDDPDK